jgi:hypothetical protein
MRRALLPLFLFVFFVGPAAALANGDDGGSQHHQTPARSAAVKQCKTERAQLGRLAFQQKYGTPHAFKNCVRANGGSDKTDQSNGDQNAEHKAGHKHHKNDDQNGDHKAGRKHHKSDQNGDQKGDPNGHKHGDKHNHDSGDN